MRVWRPIHWPPSGRVRVVEVRDAEGQTYGATYECGTWYDLSGNEPQDLREWRPWFDLDADLQKLRDQVPTE